MNVLNISVKEIQPSMNNTIQGTVLIVFLSSLNHSSINLFVKSKQCHLKFLSIQEYIEKSLDVYKVNCYNLIKMNSLF